MTSWKKSFEGDGPWPVVSNTVLPSREAMLRRYAVAMATNRQRFEQRIGLTLCGG